MNLFHESTNTPVASGSAVRLGTSRGCCIATGRHLAGLVRCARRGARTWPGGVGRECAWKTAQADALTIEASWQIISRHSDLRHRACDQPGRKLVLCFQAVTHVSQSCCGRCRSVELVFYDVLLSYIVVRCAFRVGSCRWRFDGLGALVRRRVLRKLSPHLRRSCLDRRSFVSSSSVVLWSRTFGRLCFS